MSIPILGERERVTAQMRLNVSKMVDECISAATEMGLTITRIKLNFPLQDIGLVYPVTLEEIERRGLRIISVNEMVIVPQGPGVAPTQLVSILFKTEAAS